MKYYQRIDINGDKSRLPKETGYYFVKFKQKGDSKIYADTFASHYFGEGDNKDAIWLDCIEWYLQPCTDKRDELIEKSVPEISDEEIEIVNNNQFGTIEKGDENIIEAFRSGFSVGAKWYKSELAKKFKG